jgi:cytochrome P450
MVKPVEAYHNGTLSFEQLTSNMVIVTLAGSETTATTLAGTSTICLNRFHLPARPAA